MLRRFVPQTSQEQLHIENVHREKDAVIPSCTTDVIREAGKMRGGQSMQIRRVYVLLEGLLHNGEPVLRRPVVVLARVVYTRCISAITIAPGARGLTYLVNIPLRRIDSINIPRDQGIKL